MRSLKLVAMIALMAGSVAFAGSAVVYTLGLGGDNHADAWEDGTNPMPGFTLGSLTGLPAPVNNGDSVTWEVRVTVGGLHDAPGNAEIDQKVVFGAANLVFDLELYDSLGQLVSFGAAPMVCDQLTGQCEPDGPGFWSSINDGDTGGNRGLTSEDINANAAFAIAITNEDPAPSQLLTLIDPLPGPNFDYGWFPSSNGRSGIDIDGAKTVVAIDDATLNGRLVGFGAGYKNYNYASYRPGVGKLYIDPNAWDLGFGGWLDDADPGASDPLSPPTGAVEKPLFEGQICTKGMLAGTYTLKVVPSAEGNNVLHGAVLWNNNFGNYGQMGSFAVKANDVYPKPDNNPGISFEVLPGDPPAATIVARQMFYNQSGFDGNRAAIDAAPVAGDRNDDGDAIDTSKFPLMPGAGLNVFANVSGFNKGLTGLVYDVKGAQRAPELADFQFRNIGRLGDQAAGPLIPAVAIQIWPGAGVDGADRVFISFTANTVPALPTVKSTWVEVTIGTGFGLENPETHWWGFAPGDTGPTAATNHLVNATDRSNILSNPTTPSNRSPVTDPNDIDKSSLCNATDASWVNANQTTPSTALRQISR